MASEFNTGGNCDAWCTKCKLDLAHTIVAMVDDLPVKVECNSCGGVHKYRPTKEAKEAAKEAKKAARAAAKKTSARKKPKPLAAAEVRWREAMDAHGEGKTRPYDPKKPFDTDEVLDHAHFGLGVVLRPLERQRVRVLFEDTERTLVVDLGS